MISLPYRKVQEDYMDAIPSVSQRIKTFNAPLLADKVQLKYQLMAEGPYRFFRGTCHLFYEDLSKHPEFPAAPLVWMCGDLHVENMGTYKGDNRQVYFDLNDFDEAILGPATWELVRMTTSIFVAFSHLKMEERKAIKSATLFLDTYAKTLAADKIRYIDPRTADGIVKTFLDAVSRRKQTDILRKHTKERDNKISFIIDNEKHYKLEKGLKKELKAYISHWIATNDDSPYNYRVLDVCFRVAGTGSLGVKRYLFLLQNIRNKKEYLLLDMKQATPSSLAPYLKTPQPIWESEAQRTVTIQQKAQNIPPALLSTAVFKNDSYVIQEMQPVEDKVDFNLIKKRYRDVCEVINTMATLTASAHLRSSGRQGSATADCLIDFGKNKEWQDSLLQYAIKYAAQVSADYAVYAQDFKSGFFQQ